MAKTFKAPFAQAKKSGRAVLTAANTNYSAPTAALLLYTAGAEGGQVTKIVAAPRATVTATQLQLYSSVDGGTTLLLIDSALMAAYTMAQTTAVPKTDFGYTAAAPLSLAPAERLYVAAGVALAGGIVVRADGEDF